MRVFSLRAQGSIEYLLVLGVAVLIVSVAILGVTNTLGAGAEQMPEVEFEELHCHRLCVELGGEWYHGKCKDFVGPAYYSKCGKYIEKGARIVLVSPPKNSAIMQDTDFIFKYLLHDFADSTSNCTLTFNNEEYEHEGVLTDGSLIENVITTPVVESGVLDTNWYVKCDNAGEEIESSIWSVTILSLEAGEPHVATLHADNLTTSSAVLHGELTSIGQEDEVEVYFVYRKSEFVAGSGSTKAHSPAETSKIYNFGGVVPEIVPHDSDGDYLLKFTSGTHSGNSFTIVGAGSDSYGDYLLIDEEISGPPQGDSFDIINMSLSSFTPTIEVKKNSLGEFSQTVTGLEENTIYEFRAVVEWGEKSRQGSTVSFTTLERSQVERTVSLVSPPSGTSVEEETINLTFKPSSFEKIDFCNVDINGQTQTYTQISNGVNNTVSFNIDDFDTTDWPKDWFVTCYENSEEAEHATSDTWVLEGPSDIGEQQVLLVSPENNFVMEGPEISLKFMLEEFENVSYCRIRLGPANDRDRHYLELYPQHYGGLQNGDVQEVSSVLEDFYQLDWPKYWDVYCYDSTESGLKEVRSEIRRIYGPVENKPMVGLIEPEHGSVQSTKDITISFKPENFLDIYACTITMGPSSNQLKHVLKIYQEESINHPNMTVLESGEVFSFTGELSGFSTASWPKYWNVSCIDSEEYGYPPREATSETWVLRGPDWTSPNPSVELISPPDCSSLTSPAVTLTYKPKNFQNIDYCVVYISDGSYENQYVSIFDGSVTSGQNNSVSYTIQNFETNWPKHWMVYCFDGSDGPGEWASSVIWRLCKDGENEGEYPGIPEDDGGGPNLPPPPNPPFECDDCPDDPPPNGGNGKTCYRTVCVEPCTGRIHHYGSDSSYPRCVSYEWRSNFEARVSDKCPEGVNWVNWVTQFCSSCLDTEPYIPAEYFYLYPGLIGGPCTGFTNSNLSKCGGSVCTGWTINRGMGRRCIEVRANLVKGYGEGTYYCTLDQERCVCDTSHSDCNPRDPWADSRTQSYEEPFDTLCRGPSFKYSSANASIGCGQWEVISYPC